MKLLPDENLTFRLVKALQKEYPGSCHVKDVNLTKTDDFLVWQRAQRNGFAILTQDADYEQLARLRGHPPKVIYLRFGNSTLLNLLNLLSQLRHFRDVIAAFLLHPAAACLELSQAALTDSPAE